MTPSRRKVVTRSPGRTVYTLNLPGLLPHPVEAESSLEVDAVYQLALFPWTTSIAHQPFQIDLGESSYTPDFLIHTARRRAVVEVKLSRKIPKYQEIFEKASAYLAERDFDFMVLTEKSLRSGGLHRRALELTRYAKAVWPDDMSNRVLDVLFMTADGLELNELTKTTAVPKELIYHLISTRRVTTGPDLLLDEGAQVFAVEHYLETSHEDHLSSWTHAEAWAANA